MKILHVIDDMNMGGAQSLLVELVPVQIQMGHEVKVLELSRSKDATLTEKLSKLGVEVDSLSAKMSCRNPYNIVSLIPYMRKYDVVHAHLFPANYWVALAKVFSFSKVPIIATEHSTDNKRRHNAIFRFIDNLIYGRYQEVVACSDKALETLIAVYPRINSSVIPNGVNVNRYIDADQYDKSALGPMSDNTFLSTMVARFDYPKRQDILVKAISMLPQKYHCVFVGGTEMSHNVWKVRQLASELGVSDRVHFLNTRPDVPQILKTSDAIVMVSEYEGLSLSSIEGMASGRPFIASDVNGLREVVGGAGELFACEDYEHLADIILKLSEDPVYYNDIVSKCLVRANDYNITATAEKYINVYTKYA